MIDSHYSLHQICSNLMCVSSISLVFWNIFVGFHGNDIVLVGIRQKQHGGFAMLS